MYFIIPFSLILGSVSAIGFIIWRKVPYIKKLAVADLPAKNFFFQLFSELSPELVGTCKKIKFYEYKDAWLIELEKLLRRLRLLSLRVDRLSDSLISRVRKGYQNGNGYSAATIEENTAPVKIEEKAPVNEPELLKKEEQRLIIEIAKNPKDAKLYDVLGDLYIKMRDYNDAKESFEAAMELDPNNEELNKKHSFALEKMHASKASQN